MEKRKVEERKQKKRKKSKRPSPTMTSLSRRSLVRTLSQCSTLIAAYKLQSWGEKIYNLYVSHQIIIRNTCKLRRNVPQNKSSLCLFHHTKERVDLATSAVTPYTCACSWSSDIGRIPPGSARLHSYQLRLFLSLTNWWLVLCYHRRNLHQWRFATHLHR